MIVVLNGASSSGKTTLCRALQERWQGPLLHVGTDAMIGMLPVAYVGRNSHASEGVALVDDEDERGPIVRARRGAVARRVEESYASALGSLARDGHDLVVDLVLYDPQCLAAYVRAFQGVPTHFVGVRCELSALEARERARGDRALHLARSQHEIVHRFSDFYDLEVDTTASAPESLAHSIVDGVRDNPEPKSFVTLAATLGIGPVVTVG